MRQKSALLSPSGSDEQGEPSLGASLPCRDHYGTIPIIPGPIHLPEEHKGTAGADSGIGDSLTAVTEIIPEGVEVPISAGIMAQLPRQAGNPDGLPGAVS